MTLCVFEILMTFESVASALCCESVEDIWKLIWKYLVLHADLFDPDYAIFELQNVVVYVIVLLFYALTRVRVIVVVN